MITDLFQIPLNLDDAAAVALPVSTPDGPLLTWVDSSTVELLAGRRLSLGSHGYPACWNGGTMTPLHRMIMGLKIRDGLFVDHISGDPLDNRTANLRVVTAAENAANRACSSKSGYRGVVHRGGKFEAYGKSGGVAHYLGSYPTALEAAEVAHLWRVENLPGYCGSDRNRYSNAAPVSAALVAA